MLASDLRCQRVDITTRLLRYRQQLSHESSSSSTRRLPMSWFERTCKQKQMLLLLSISPCRRFCERQNCCVSNTHTHTRTHTPGFTLPLCGRRHLRCSLGRHRRLNQFTLWCFHRRTQHKDRIIRSILSKAEDEGKLFKGMTVVCASSGQSSLRPPRPFTSPRPSSCS
jgi:hypothetical protein